MDRRAALVDGLEPDQLAAATDRPLPRRKLGPVAVILLILLRVYVVLAIVLVGYAFLHALTAP